VHSTPSDKRRGRGRHSRRRGWRCSQPAGDGATAREPVSQTGGRDGGESPGTPTGGRGAAYHHPRAPSSAGRPRLLVGSLTVQEPLPSMLLAGKSSAASSHRLPRAGTRTPSKSRVAPSVPSFPPSSTSPTMRLAAGPLPRWWFTSASLAAFMTVAMITAAALPACASLLSSLVPGTPPPARHRRRSTFPPVLPPTRPRATRPPTSAASTRRSAIVPRRAWSMPAKQTCARSIGHPWAVSSVASVPPTGVPSRLCRGECMARSARRPD